MKKSLVCLILNISLFSIGFSQVGIGTSSPVSSSLLEVKSTSKGFLPPRMTTTQRNAINSPVAGLTIFNTTSKGYEVFNGNTWYSTVHYVGEQYGGGIVFFIYDNGQHGLIAATADQSTGAKWWDNVGYNITGATGDGLNAGYMNTIMIVSKKAASDQTGTFAAKIAADYSVTVDGITYGDWYLPSKYELNLLYLQRIVVGGFANEYYWSSREGDQQYAWSQYFVNGNQFYSDKNDVGYVRVVRAF